jgi:hypothetical protein
MVSFVISILDTMVIIYICIPAEEKWGGGSNESKSHVDHTGNFGIVTTLFRQRTVFRVLAGRAVDIDSFGFSMCVQFNGEAMKKIIALCTLAMLMNMAMLYASPRQMQPDSKRIHQINEALEEHGYLSGKTWAQTQEICRSIAREHGWQTHRAPDARVLILLGLGNKHSDPDILTWPHNHLDGGEDEKTAIYKALEGKW